MIYKRIRDLREDRDLTQKQIAKELKCSQQVYSNYELGQRDIPTDILIKLSDFYDVSVDYILGISDIAKIQKWERYDVALIFCVNNIFLKYSEVLYSLSFYRDSFGFKKRNKFFFGVKREWIFFKYVNQIGFRMK